MSRISFKHRLEYTLLRGGVAVVRGLPRPWALALGKMAGRLGFLLFRGRSRLALDNIRRALPELDEAQARNLALRSFEQMGIGGVESVRLDQLTPDQLDTFFDLEGIEHLRQAQALHRGVILLTAHLGFWEAGNYVFPVLGVELDTIAKPLKNPLSEKFFQKIRRHFGADLINSRHGARRILKSLQANRAVGLLLDQHIAPPGSTPVDFFGRKAFTTTAITSMAMKYQIPIVPSFCLRTPDFRYRTWMEPMVLLEGDDEEAVNRNTQILTDIIERAVRQDPSQWFWVHRRWRDKKVRKYLLRNQAQSPDGNRETTKE